MKKFKLLTLLPFLALSSCGMQSYAGTYGFRLGKDKDSHISLNAILSNEKYEGKVESKNDLKKFKLTVDAKMLGDSGDEEYEQIKDLILSLLRNGVDGYYYVTDEVAPNGKGKTLRIGTTIDDFLTMIDINEETRNQLKEIGNIDIAPELIESLIYSYTDGSTVTLDVPVSVDDLFYQFDWYGQHLCSANLTNLRIFDLEKDFNIPLPSVAPRKNRIGTSPTQEDIIYMNNNYGEAFANTVVYSYSTTEGIGKRIGYIEKVNEENSGKYQYKFRKATIINPEYDEDVTLPLTEKLVTISGVQDINGYLTLDEHNFVTFLDKDTKEKVYMELLFEEPSTFRNIYRVPIKLKKM